MTLLEIMELRQNKYKPCSCSDFQKGYETGWYWAYQDLKEILEQNGFDLNVVVIDDNEDKETKRSCETCYANDMDYDEVDNPCWNCKGDYSEWYPKR